MCVSGEGGGASFPEYYPHDTAGNSVLSRVPRRYRQLSSGDFTALSPFAHFMFKSSRGRARTHTHTHTHTHTCFGVDPGLFTAIYNVKPGFGNSRRDSDRLKSMRACVESEEIAWNYDCAQKTHANSSHQRFRERSPSLSLA